MLHIILHKNRRGLHLSILTSMLMALGLLAIRIHLSETPTYIFLVWNLFLASIPFMISTFLQSSRWIDYRKLFLIPLLGLWLLFFPNAPYIATDLFHLKTRAGIPLWYDLALLLIFSWNGIIIGFASLMDVQKIISKVFNQISGWLFAIFTLVLSSFGIYLGRFLRWNSWDILTHPKTLLIDVLGPFVHPFSHPRAIGMTLVFSIFLICGYLTLKHLMSTHSKGADSDNYTD